MVLIEQFKPECVKSGQTLLIVGNQRNNKNHHLRSILNKLNLIQNKIFVFSAHEISSPEYTKIYKDCHKYEAYSAKILTQIMLDQENELIKLKEEYEVGTPEYLEMLEEVRGCIIFDEVLLTKDDWTDNWMLIELLNKSHALELTTIILTQSYPTISTIPSQVNWVLLTESESIQEQKKYYQLIKTEFKDFEMFQSCFVNLTKERNAMLIQNGLQPKLYWSNIQGRDPDLPIIVRLEGDTWFIDGQPHSIQNCPYQFESVPLDDEDKPKKKASWYNPMSWYDLIN